MQNNNNESFGVPWTFPVPAPGTTAWDAWCQGIKKKKVKTACKCLDANKGLECYFMFSLCYTRLQQYVKYYSLGLCTTDCFRVASRKDLLDVVVRETRNQSKKATKTKRAWAIFSSVEAKETQKHWKHAGDMKAHKIIQQKTEGAHTHTGETNQGKADNYNRWDKSKGGKDRRGVNTIYIYFVFTLIQICHHVPSAIDHFKHCLM